MNASHIYLALAILAEVAGTSCMKLSEGFSRPVPSIAMGVLYAASLAMLTLALRGIDVSVAYAIWSGVGTAAITAIGVVAFGEPLGLWKAVCTGVVILGVVGLHLTSAGH